MIWFKDNLTEEELKKEYWKLAKKYHPDVNKSPDADEIMKEINDQFDKYWVNQKVREFEWMDTQKAAQASRKARATVLCWLRRDTYNPGKFYSIVDEKHTWFWFWREVIRIKGVSDDGPEWEGFRGGLAYCEYESNSGDHDEVRLKKLPAKISPATAAELYYYNKDHWGSTRFDIYYEVQCRFGTFWARKESAGYIFYVKAELPEKFLKIGNSSDEEAKYSARSINLVYVNSKWIQEAKILRYVSGLDLPFIVYQDCTEEEFCHFHDVDNMTSAIHSVGVKRIREDFWFISDPVVALCARKGIIELYSSLRNFRMRCGYFRLDTLMENLHLFTIEDIETVQDYLDIINKEFDDHFKQLIKSGRIAYKI